MPEKKAAGGAGTTGVCTGQIFKPALVAGADCRAAQAGGVALSD